MVLNIKRFLSLDTPFPCESAAPAEEVAKPYPHQVAGHTPFSYLPNGHLLKPCAERELKFYAQMPKQLLSIAPKCCAIIQSSSVNTLPSCCAACLSSTRSAISIPSSMEGSPILNKRKLSRNFLIMSDLTHGFIRPCVLDLKLGTRQYGDGANEGKIQKQEDKCRNSTSAKLGIRLCGMKYFPEMSDSFKCLDKYLGRSLNEAGLHAVVSAFFSHSKQSTLQVLKKVETIKQVIREAEGMRFFGASLLIVIEGPDPAAGQQSDDVGKVEVRLVDYAKATFPGFLSDSHYTGVDEGSLLGLDTLCKFLTTPV